MTLNIYMVGVIVSDMAAAIAFYRRLGLAIPDDAEARSHIEIPMGAMTLFLSTQDAAARWDPAFKPPSGGGYRIILEFFLETGRAVDAKYADLVAHGYRSHAAPSDVGDEMRFAFVNDPDGNTVLLTGLRGDRDG